MTGRTSRGGDGEPGIGPEPIRVAFVEVCDGEVRIDGAPVSELRDDRPDGGRYASAWTFFTCLGRLAGEAHMPFEEGRVMASHLIGEARRVRAIDGDTAGDKAVDGDAIDGGAWDEPLDDLPFATVAVPTCFARGAALDRAVAALAAQRYPADRFEVLVVDNRPAHAQDRSQWRALERHPEVRVLSQPRPGASAARNRALAEARGAIIAYTDDDAVADRDWLRRLAHRLTSTPEADCATGLVLPGELETPAQIWFEESGSAPNRRFRPACYQTIAGADAITGLTARRRLADRFTVADRLATRPDDPGTERRFSIYALGDMGTGSNMAFRVDALRALGGFDEALGPGTLTSSGGEDILVFLRVLARGRSIAVEPAAYVRHWHRRTYPQLRAQIRGYGRAFTAMLAAAVLDDPRHLWGLARVVPTGALAMLGVGSEKASHRSAGYPADLRRVELIGMLGGPWSYLRSRWRARRESARRPDPPDLPRSDRPNQSDAYATTQST